MASKPKRQYKEETLSAALQAIRNGMGVNKTSRQFGVPRATLQDRLHGRVREGQSKMGPNPFLSQAEEIKIVEWCINLTKCGFPRKQSDILNTVQKLIIDDNRKTPFKNGRPGKKWFASFLKRNPQLVERTNKEREVITEEFIRKWFTELENYLMSIECLDVLNDPKRIFNGDETSFSMCPKTGKVLAPKGFKNVYQISKVNEKETLTVFVVFSAYGETVPPLVVFPYVRTPKEIVDSMPEHWFLGKSESGWMRSDIFHDYIVNGVDKWVMNQNITKPVILFVDGHKSHLTLNLSEYCSKNGIILYSLPPNAAHIMQPADVSVFRPLKQQWKSTMKEWLGMPENLNTMITKITFCPVLKMVLDKIDMVNAIKNGFKGCGLYPLDPNAVDYTKCIQNKRENLAAVSTNNSEEEIKTKTKNNKNNNTKESENKSKIECSLCSEDLLSDVDEDSEKNIGCNSCIRWYHLRCTIFEGMSYEDAAKQDFTCFFCAT